MSFKTLQLSETPQVPDMLDPIISRRSAVLEQLRASQRLLAEPTCDLPVGIELQPALIGWIGQLTYFLEDGAAALACPDNVDVTDKPAWRAKALWKLICQVVDELDKKRPKETDDAFKRRKENIKRFMLHLAWHEGARNRYRKQQPKGPGRSFFQIEPVRAIDCCEYAKTKDWLGKLAAACDRTKAEIEAACKALTKAGWPKDNLIEKCLCEKDLFAVYMARICLKREPKAIPEGNDKHADYWADKWKRVFGEGQDKETKKSTFKGEADEVDKLVPAS